MKALATILLAVNLSAVPDRDPKKPASQTQKDGRASMTGCLDQSRERYVLRSETDMTALTQLKGKGFSDDNLARYIGRRVTVPGKANGDVFEVVKVEKLAETCSR